MSMRPDHGGLPQSLRFDTRFSTLLLAVAFPLFSLLLYLPGALYFSNVDEFTLRTRDLVLIFLPAFGFSAAVGVGLLRLLPKTLRGRLIALAFGVGLALWVQGSLLVWQYGTFDGRTIHWEEFRLDGLIDTPVWVVLLGTALLAPVALVKAGRVAAMVVMAVQSVLLALSASSAARTDDDPSARNYAIDGAPKYAFSPNRNVILFVLDAFQADVFQEIILEEPEYTDYFQGFTWFRDALAASNYTELAIPALLTGRLYDNSQPREDFLRDAFLESGITTLLKRDGFVVDIYPWMGWGNESIYFDEAIASNLARIDARRTAEPTFTEKNGKEALHLLDLSFFRAVPHFLKPYIVNDQKWLITYAATYLLPEGVKQTVTTDDRYAINTFLAQAPPVFATDRGARVFKYFHLKGAHSPLTVDEDLNFTPGVLPFTRDAYVAQAKANLAHLHRFFSKLREAGIYDSSLILVLGDHGSGETPEMWIDSEGPNARPVRLAGTGRNFRRDKARALPLVLVKRIGATGSLDRSDAPVSLRDVPATILSELGMERADGGPSMFEVTTDEPRVRYHGAFEFSPNKTGYVDPITLYRVDGDSWLDESWAVERIVAPASAVDSERVSRGATRAGE